MKKPLLMVLLCLPVIGLADSAFAALGETEAQIEKRYGPAVVTSITDAPPDVYEKYHLRAYLMEPYYITVWFNKSGVAEYEEVKKVRVPSLNNQTQQVAQEFGDPEIQDFLHANSSYDGPFVEEAKAAADEKDYRVW